MINYIRNGSYGFIVVLKNIFSLKLTVINLRSALFLNLKLSLNLTTVRNTGPFSGKQVLYYRPVGSLFCLAVLLDLICMIAIFFKL